MTELVRRVRDAECDSSSECLCGAAGPEPEAPSDCGMAILPARQQEPMWNKQCQPGHGAPSGGSVCSASVVRPFLFSSADMVAPCCTDIG
jgi:hypothetical protein